MPAPASSIVQSTAMTRLKRRTLISVLALAGLAALLAALHNFRAKRALRAFKAELIAKFDMNLNYRTGFNVALGSALVRYKSVAQWLSVATLNALHTGRLNDAATNLNALLSLVNALRDQRMIIYQLVRIAIAAIGIPPT